MNVLIISKFFTPMPRARAIQMQKVVDALHAGGCAVCVVAGRDDACGAVPRFSYPVEYIATGRMTDMWQAKGAARRAAGRVRNMYVRTRWISAAARKAARLADTFRPNVLLTVSEPYDSHLAGLRLRRRRSIPWVTYFSDPAPLAALPPPYNRQTSSLMNRLEIRAVRPSLTTCDAILMTNQHGVRCMERAFGLPLAWKSACVPHIGTPPWRSVPCTNPRLTHVGDLYRRLSVPLLEAVRRAAQEVPGFPGLLFVGDIPDALNELVRRQGVEPWVEVRERLPHAAAQELAASSRALLVIEAAMPESPFLPSKFADYAMTGRPILAITPRASAIRDYLTRYGGGIAVEADADRIFAAIQTLYAASGAGDAGTGRGGPGKLAALFSQEAVAARYIEIFQSLTPGSGSMRSQ